MASRLQGFFINSTNYNAAIGSHTENPACSEFSRQIRPYGSEQFVQKMSKKKKKIGEYSIKKILSLKSSNGKRCII